jgi:hypothetical protein
MLSQPAGEKCCGFCNNSCPARPFIGSASLFRLATCRFGLKCDSASCVGLPCSWTSLGTYALNSSDAFALTQMYLGPMRRLAAAGVVSIWPAGDEGVDVGSPQSAKFPVKLQT